MPSPTGPASYPSAKISTRSPWRRKASRKKRGVPEAHSSDDNIIQGKGSLQENGAPGLSPQSHVSSEKNNEHDEDATIAETLHTVADKFLHLDVLDQKDDTRRFIGYLLDTIDMLQATAQ